MKLTHFLVLAGLVAALGIFGLTKACKKDSSDDVPPPSPTTASSRPTPTPTPAVGTTTPPTTPTTPAGTSDLAARPYDQEVIAWSTRAISGDKMKDATKGKPYKVNLYMEAGHKTVNRAKVDIDRDDKFDEKYTFETTKITLERAPNDDEQYTETYHWNGNGWTKAGAASAKAPPSDPPTGTTPTAPAGTSDLAARPYDQEVIAWSKRAISGDKMKDATKGKPYKVNLYMEAGHSTVNRAKVDIDRDDKFDEKYTFDTNKITLERSPNDDEQFSETYHWNGNGWTKE